MRVDPVAPRPGPVAPRRTGAASGFAGVLEGAAGPRAADQADEPASVASPVAVLAGEAGAVAPWTEAADQEARRHDRAMLKALGAVQLAMLGGGEAEARAELAALAAGLPQAEDPVLRLILREIGARAAVEMARGST